MPSLELDTSPSMLLHCPVGEKTTEDGAQDDDEDASASVLARG